MGEKVNHARDKTFVISNSLVFICIWQDCNAICLIRKQLCAVSYIYGTCSDVKVQAFKATWNFSLLNKILHILKKSFLLKKWGSDDLFVDYPASLSMCLSIHVWLSMIMSDPVYFVYSLVSKLWVVQFGYSTYTILRSMEIALFII